MKLSLLIPVYNEARTIPALLDKLDLLELPAGVERELIFVDDASTDGSDRILRDMLAGKAGVKIIRHPKNLGKGAAIRSAAAQAVGDIVVIQDADLEYDPADLSTLITPILEGRSDVVFGSRNLVDNPRYSWIYYWGNMLLNACVFMLYGRYITDMETCYKMMRRQIFMDLNIQSNSFDIEPEITAKLLKRKLPILEIPIRYHPRTRAEGKKITALDGLRAIRALLFWRFAADIEK